MIDRLVSVFRALIFILIGLALCGIIFQAAGYSTGLMFQSIAEEPSCGPARCNKLCDGACHCSSQRLALLCPFAQATSISVRKDNSIWVPLQPHSWPNG